MFKKVKVVMLPTNEKAFSNLNLHGNVLSYTPAKHCNGQHLYFLSDEEIKEGDWMFHNLDEKPIQWNGEETETNPNVYGYKKIIATTDKSLGADYNGAFGGLGKFPQPSQSFIEKYVDEYNKGNVITEVMVEYEKYIGKNYVGEFTTEKDFDYKLKVNPKDNTITIRKVKESWNREEFMKFGNWCRIHDSKFPNQVWTIQQLFDKWIEENL